MDFSRIELDDGQRSFAEEVRELLAECLSEEEQDRQYRVGSGFDETLHMALGSKGWLMPTWPVERGGAGLDPLRARVLELELRHAGVSNMTILSLRSVWPAVEKHLDAELVEELRPKVARGYVRFCLGYTEPDGGSDIASAKFRATRDGDEWILSGSKIFTTEAQNSQFIFLLTRTDPTRPKHEGLTMFLVPTGSPGIEIQAIRTFGGERTNIVFFDDVRVSDRFRLGAVNGGWAVLRGPLDEEHSLGGAESALEDLSIGGSDYALVLAKALQVATDWASTAVREDGRKVSEDDAVKMRLGMAATDVEVARSTPGPMGRVFGSEALIRGAADLLDLVGTDGLLMATSRRPNGLNELEFAHRYAQGTATYGGTVEVFRDMIAQHVLGLPRLDLPGRKVFLQNPPTSR